MSRTVVQEARPLDHIYDFDAPHYAIADPVSTGAGGRGFPGAGSTRNGPILAHKFANMENYGRASPTPKAGTARFTPQASPFEESKSSVARSPSYRPVEELVHGQQRYKFFKKPNVTVLDAAAGNIRLDTKPLAPAAHPAVSPRMHDRLHAMAEQDDAENYVEYREDGTRSLAVQTMYRESAAQTDPYTPEYVLEAGTKPPEVLKLAHLKYGGEQGKSLPAGKAEIEAIELARQRARIESSLPPTTDEASFEIRKVLMEQLELAAMRTREGEIDTLHQDKLAVVEQQLRAREAEREFIAEQRVEEMRRRLEMEKEATLANIANRRIKLLRKMGKQRQQVETHIDMLTGTGAFVGVSTGNAAGGSKGRKATRDIIAEYADYGSRVYAPSVKDGRFPDKLRVAAQLEVRAPELETADGLADLTKTLPSKVLAMGTIKPVLEKDTTSGAKKQDSIARDLERIHTAILTTKAGKSTVAVENESIPAWRKPKPVVVRPKTPTFDPEDEGTDDVELEMALLLVQTLMRGRAVQNVMYEGKERRLELIHEMRADLLTADAVAAIEAEERQRQQQEDTQIARDALIDTATGEVVSATLDFFSKELVRQKEMQQVAAFASIADEERRKREAAETARRQAELIARAKQAERDRRLDAINSTTACTYIDAIVADSIEAAATATASLEANIRHLLVGPVLDELEAEYQAAAVEQVGDEVSAAVVRDLLTSVVLNAVNFEMRDAATAAAEAHFEEAAKDAVVVALEAAANMLTGETNDVMEAVKTATEAVARDPEDLSIAATKIQAAFRGCRARKEVKAIRKSYENAAQ